MQSFRFVSLFLLLLLLGCANLDLKSDSNPSPSDATIAQARMEFSGCGYSQQIGQIVCRPGETLSVQTEFPGFLIYFSSSSDGACSLRQDRRAQQPVTKIILPTFERVCSLTVYYLPDYPRAARAVFPIRGVWGEVTVDPEQAWLGHQAITDHETAQIQMPPGTLRGYWVSRQHPDPTAFTGSAFTIQSLSIGTELVQIKYWDSTEEPKFGTYTINFYSFRSILLRPDIMKDKKLRIQFPPEVSLVSHDGEIDTDLKLTLPLRYTGLIRAYTVQGRTAILKIMNGIVEEL